jgi:hyperosmotically inducible periplasmic protein
LSIAKETKRRKMKISRLSRTVLTLLFAAALAGCSGTSSKSPDVSKSVRDSLDQAGLQAVKVSQDRDLGVVTLTGQVPSDDQKAQAESIARPLVAPQVVANQVTVAPPGGESDAKKIDSDLDSGIEKDLDAALIQHGMKAVKYDVSQGVVKLTGDVNSQSRRAEAQRVAAGVPNVKQVVNELQVKKQKATATN